MLKFNKVLDSRVVTLIIASVFLLNNIAYGIGLFEKSNLRKPSDFNGEVSSQRHHNAYNVLEIEKIIETYLPQIKAIARHLKPRLPPNVELDDLVSAGVIGLIDAFYKFDPSRGVQFNTYAEWRIRGAMLDSLRRLDWAPRMLRIKAKKIDKVIARLRAELGRPPSDQEIADAMKIEIDKLLDIQNGINTAEMRSLDNGFPDSKSRADARIDVAAEAPSQEDMAIQRELVAVLVDGLPENEQLVLNLYYYEELTMKEIGKVLGVDESRICQLHTKAMRTLRKHMARLGLMGLEDYEEQHKILFVKPYADFNEAFQVFRKGRIEWLRTDPEITGTPEIWLGFVSKLAEARKKEPKELNTTDFHKGVIAGKTVVGLLYYAIRKYKVPGGAYVLYKLKEELGIIGSSKPEALRQAL